MNHAAALSVFLVLFILVTVLGFVASRWKQGDLHALDEWGLGGRRFGTLIAWFLLGGDLYTAYTFIAVPALVYGTGAMGFFAMPYTISVFPILFLIMPRLWHVSKRHGYVTPADFVQGRYGSEILALLVAGTGILATMPYIALQLIGIQVVLAAMGLHGEWPLVLAFTILAVYTYQAGLRAPALISIVKDLLIYITVLAAVWIIPAHLGGYGAIFRAARQALPAGADLILPPARYLPFASLALGSSLALFVYPHVVTGVLSSSSARVIRRNAALLPAYSFLLGLLALLGYMALAAGVGHKPEFAQGFAEYKNSFAVPALFIDQFPDWFVGVAAAAIAIGALVPAAIMSIAAANLFTRHIYRQYINRDCSTRDETQVAKVASMVVKLGALLFIVWFPREYAINLQLLGGVWIVQTFPAVITGLYTNRLHRYGLALGWLVGMVVGTAMMVSQNFNSIYTLHVGDTAIAMYSAVWGLLANYATSVVFSILLPRYGIMPGEDATSAGDYEEPASSV